MQRIRRCDYRRDVSHKATLQPLNTATAGMGKPPHACIVLGPHIFFLTAANLSAPRAVVTLEAGTEQSTLNIDQDVLGGGYDDEYLGILSTT